MNNTRMDCFREFAKYLEYPVVIFEAESGEVIELNYEAEVLLGKRVKQIFIEPGRALTKLDFWEMLHGKKSLIWHRIRMMADDKEFLVSGLVNEAKIDDKTVYTLLFERRADLNIGSLTLERIVNHAGIVAVHMSKQGDDFLVEYMSQNINQYGYTRAQFYEKTLLFENIICEDDYCRIREMIQTDSTRHRQENMLECRMFTEERQLIPVRVMIHYSYNEYGALTDLEFLLFDMREDYRKNQENAYLSHAISKMKNVVLVKSYRENQRNLLYVSPNANMVGMNVEALTKGYKLTEDYIHPEDRDRVIDSIYHAVSEGITDCVQEYRMVTDDGKQIWVENELTITEVSKGEAEISFLLTDITERKSMEQELSATLALELGETIDRQALSREQGETESEISELTKQFQLMAETLSQNANYYSVVLSLEGKQLTKPCGPVQDIGQFYDLFERPAFKEAFAQLEDRKTPHGVEFQMDAIQVSMVFAPLFRDGEIKAYWVLTSFLPDGLKQLNDLVGPQWQLANTIVKSFWANEAMETEHHLRRLTEVQLHKEQKELQLLEELNYIVARDGEQGIPELCQKVGTCLSLHRIGIYTKDEDGASLYYAWNPSDENPGYIEQMIASESEYEVIKGHLMKESYAVVDRRSENAQLKNMVKQTDAGAIMLFSLPYGDCVEGYIVMADSDREREYDKRDLEMGLQFAAMVSGVLEVNKKSVKLDLLREGFLDAYDHIRDAVFVKNNRSGDIIFSNKAMDKLFGYSTVGMQAGEIVSDQMEQYRSIQSVRKRFIANKKVTKWQSYMKELDQIMNIVEVQLDTIGGSDCSLVILKKNKNKDKKKS